MIINFNLLIEYDFSLSRFLVLLFTGAGYLNHQTGNFFINCLSDDFYLYMDDACYTWFVNFEFLISSVYKCPTFLYF